jgi:hypothetical protein
MATTTPTAASHPTSDTAVEGAPTSGGRRILTPDRPLQATRGTCALEPGESAGATRWPQDQPGYQPTSPHRSPR